MESRVNAVTNNLRQYGAAAQQYMLAQGVTEAVYTDIVSTATDAYIHGISPVAGEDYSQIVVDQTDSQISISSATFGTVTYGL
jgi:hypothetical protein